MVKNKNHRKIWKNMGIQKLRGGLSFRDLATFNKAMLAKQFWKILSIPISFVSTTLRCKYFSRGSVLEAKVGSRPLFLWRSLVSSIPLVKAGMFWNISNDWHTKIWVDKLVPRPTSYKIQSPMHILRRDAYVRELIDSPFTSWNKNLIS